MTRFNARIVASIRDRFYRSSATVAMADDDTLLRAYALFRAEMPQSTHDVWQHFPSYVKMTPADRTKQWAVIFNRKD